MLPPIERINTIKSIKSDEAKHQENLISNRKPANNEEIATSTTNSLYSGLGKIFLAFTLSYSVFFDNLYYENLEVSFCMQNSRSNQEW